MDNDALGKFMNNPHFRGIIEHATSKTCRAYIEKSLVYGSYCGTDPENPKTKWEDGMTVQDWEYVLKYLAGNTMLATKCRKKIKELAES